MATTTTHQDYSPMREVGLLAIISDEEIEKNDREERRRKKECFNILIRKEYNTLIL